MQWDTTDCYPTSGAWTLAGITATEATSDNAGIRTDAPLPLGKVYWEVVPSATASFDSFVGVAFDTADITSGLVNDPGTCMFRSNGSTFANGFSAAYGLGGYSPSDVLMFAADTTTGKLWLGKNGSWITGDPAADTSPAATWTPGGNLHPAVGADNNAGSHSFQGRFVDAAFSYSPPSGFTKAGLAFILSGVVKDSAGAGVSRTVRAYLRSNGALSASSVSAGDGSFTISVANTAEHFAIAFDPDENAVVFDHLTPVVV